MGTIRTTRPQSNDLATVRSLRPCASFKLDKSRIRRVDNLSVGISAPSCSPAEACVFWLPIKPSPIYVQDMVPLYTGLVARLLHDFASRIATTGAAGLGVLADAWGIRTAYQICAFLSLPGQVGFLLPEPQGRENWLRPPT